MIGFCQFGAGRIGAIHAGNIASHPDARLRIVVDPDRAAAERLAGRYGAGVGSQTEALADPSVSAVVIASSTDTHADLVEAASRAGKAVFCEKPLDLDRGRAEACVAVAENRENAREQKILTTVDFAVLRGEEADERLGHRETDCGHFPVLQKQRVSAKSAEDTPRKASFNPVRPPRFVGDLCSNALVFRG